MKGGREGNVIRGDPRNGKAKKSPRNGKNGYGWQFEKEQVRVWGKALAKGHFQ